VWTVNVRQNANKRVDGVIVSTLFDKRRIVKKLYDAQRLARSLLGRIQRLLPVASFRNINGLSSVVGG
jgi:hypothetical protein